MGWKDKERNNLAACSLQKLFTPRISIMGNAKCCWQETRTHALTHTHTQIQCTCIRPPYRLYLSISMSCVFWLVFQGSGVLLSVLCSPLRLTLVNTVSPGALCVCTVFPSASQAGEHGPSRESLPTRLAQHPPGTSLLALIMM